MFRTIATGFVLLAACLFHPIRQGEAHSHGDRPPNFIIILADDLGWADLACYGNTFNETPNIDRLAREGMRFTQFYAGPVCSPTRANMQSGQDQARFGITQHIPGHRRPFARLIDPVVPPHLPLEVETFAERLATVGYATGYFGKWHLGGSGFGPEEQGWQTVLECQGNTLPPRITGAKEVRRTADFLTEQAIDFIHANRDRPFLLQVSHFAVHIPLSTTPELLAKYEAKPPMPGYPSLPAYAGLLEELDQSVGRIADAVDAGGLTENTLILLLSDNGGLEHEQSGRVVTSNRPLRGEKGMLYEGGIRIPAIARWPSQVPAHSVCDRPVITMDLYPTFVELAAARMPSHQPCDGVSLASLLRDPTSPLDRTALFWHLPHYHHCTPASAIRQDDWKLIEFFESGAVELYHLGKDLSEQNNLAAAEPDRANRMRTALAEWRKDVGARRPRINPNYDPARAGELAKRPGKPKRVSAEKPNIVLILADDLGYGDLGCYGHPVAKTPHIDSLARQGVRFTQHYSNGAECTPTRTALLTGRYQHRAGGMECAIGTGNVGRYDDAIRLAAQGELGLPVEQTVLPGALKEVGYACGIFGKWHLGYEPKFLPLEHGWDAFFGYLGGNVHYFEHYELSDLHVLFRDREPTRAEGYVTHLITDASIDFIQQHRERPFFLFVSHQSPHFPFQGPEDRDKVVTKENWTQPDDATYVAMLEDLDSEVGRLLAALQQQGLANDTLVVFVSDNGGFEGAAHMGPLRSAKSTTFEGGIRVPLIIRWPGRIPAGTLSHQVSATFDLTRSFLSLTGARVPADRLDGKDIIDHVVRQRDDFSRTLFWRDRRGDQTWWAVRDGDWKYVRQADGTESEQWLFDLSRDVGEQHCLLVGKPAETQRIQELLGHWESEVRAKR